MDISLYENNNKNELINLIKTQKIDFPYKKYLLTENDIKKKFENLKNYEPIIVEDEKYTIRNLENESFFTEDIMKFQNKYTLILNEEQDYEKYNMISDYFNENCRMICKRYDTELSPYQFWIKKPEVVIDYAYKNYKKVNIHTLREAIYKLSNECTSFKPTLIVSIIKLFNAKSILDFSAGWGDRLIGAISQNVKYYGVDPNPCLHENYQKIINMLAENKNNYTMIQSPFEDAPLPSYEYDLIFTSPPYFILENYTDVGKENQSISKYQELDLWLNNFLFYSIDKAWSKLSVGGHLVLIINNIKNFPNFIKKLIEKQTNQYSKYLGVISYTESNKKFKSPQPMWIWEKIGVNLNPPLVIEKISKFYVIRDDYLIGGTKQRLVYKFMEKSNCDTFVYAGPYQGYAQIALSYCAYVMKKKAIIVLDKIKPRSHLTEKALKYNPKLIEIENGYLKKLQEIAMNLKAEKTCILPFGLNNPELILMLAKQIIKASPKELNPKRLWLVAGSTTLLNALYIVFPFTHFCVVQVGKKVWDDQLKKERTTLYISEEKFEDIAKEQPPYPTVKTYDAKLWTFVMKYGIEGDYIWNVGRD